MPPVNPKEFYMAERDPKKFPHKVGGVWYSDKKVLQSGAGYYIGTTCWDTELNFEDSGSRESDYFKTREEAQKALDTMDFEVRECMENQYAYEQGLPKPQMAKEPPLCPKCNVTMNVMLFMGVQPEFYTCPKCGLAYDMKTLKALAVVIGTQPYKLEEKAPLIPEEVLKDSGPLPIACCWRMSNGDFAMAVRIPDEWVDPGAWGVLFADMVRNVVKAYGPLLPDRTEDAIEKRIVGMFQAEIKRPTGAPSGHIVTPQ